MKNFVVQTRVIFRSGHGSSMVRFFYYKNYAEYCAKEMHRIYLLDTEVKYHYIRINGKIVFDTRSWWHKFKNFLKIV